jgi:hypothetical protein
MKKPFIKTVCSLLVIIMFMGSFFNFALKKSQADNSVAGYITSLAPVITKMPGCKQALGNGITDLFNKVKDLFTSKTKKATDAAAKKAANEVGLDVIGVADQETREGIVAANEKLDAQKKAQEKMEQNQNCLNGIGKAIAKVLINNATNSIINWIQTGDEGNPLFPQDYGAYFKNIAEDEILGFGAEIRDPNLYPFAKDFMQAQKNSFTSKFANNAQYSLDKMIRDANPEFSAQTFSQDFSQGGWNAWDAMTQNAANNPLGFSLMASNELAKRIEDKTSLAQGSLQMSGGFLSVEQCADPKGVTKEENDAGLKERASDPDGPYENRICNNWEAVTPGKLVGEQLVSTVQKQDHALLDVATLNDALAAILDTVFAKFTSKLQSKEGFMSVEGNSSYEFNNDAGFGNNQNEQDYSSNQINESTWLQDHPDFNIRTDLNQALVDEQRIYQDKLREQNKELFSQVTPDPNDKTTSLGNYGLIPTIYQLDYCIPGPHPGWEQDTRDALDKELEKVINTDGKNFLQIGQMTGRAPNVGSSIMVIASLLGAADTETIDNWAKLLGTGHAHCGSSPQVSVSECLSREVYQGYLEDFTHIHVTNRDDDHLQSYNKFVNIIERVYDQYVKAMKNIYISEVLPSATPEAKTEFEKIDGFNKTIEQNIKTINSLTATITRLTEIKKEIDILNESLASNQISQDDYNAGLVPWKNAFARLSSNLYSGDDIAEADNLTKQIIDEKDYVYKNLILGATGCEQESSASLNAPQFKWLSGGSMLNRPDYPLPILYKYSDTNTNKAIRGFLYYGSYNAWPNPSIWPYAHQRDETRAMCHAYEVYGGNNYASDCDTGNTGVNYIHVSDLLNFEGGPQSGLLGTTFERKLQIY